MEDPVVSVASSDARRHRRLSCLLGLAAGDKNGGPLRMVCVSAESLLQCDTRGVEEVDIARIRDGYLQWYLGGHALFRCFDSGPTFERVAALVHSSRVPWEVAAQRVGAKSAGVNAAHRCAPVALCAVDVLQSVATEARTTHVHEEAVAVAQCFALILRHVVDNGVSSSVDVLAVAKRALVDMQEAGFAVPDYVRRAVENPRAVMTNGGHAPEVLAATLHFVSTARSFDEMLKESIRFAGPSNYCPVLVGCLGGAVFAPIEPNAHLAHLNADELKLYIDVAKKIADKDN